MIDAMPPKRYYVYIMASRSRALYTGVTNNLARRVQEHKRQEDDSYTARYNITRLVWYRAFSRPQDAIAAEKKIKGWRRSKKDRLIESRNSEWRDLSEDVVRR